MDNPFDEYHLDRFLARLTFSHNYKTFEDWAWEQVFIVRQSIKSVIIRKQDD